MAHAARANREQADLENQGIDLSTAEALNLEAFAATARAAMAAAAHLQAAYEAMRQVQQMARDGALRAEQAHRAAVALTSQITRLEKAA